MNTLSSFLMLLIVALITALAFWKGPAPNGRGSFLYILACPVLCGYSWTIYDTFRTPLGIILTLVIAAIGAFCLVSAIMHLSGKW